MNIYTYVFKNKVLLNALTLNTKLYIKKLKLNLTVLSENCTYSHSNNVCIKCMQCQKKHNMRTYVIINCTIKITVIILISYQ